MQGVTEKFARGSLWRDSLCGSPPPQLLREQLIEGYAQMHGLDSRFLSSLGAIFGVERVRCQGSHRLREPDEPRAENVSQSQRRHERGPISWQICGLL